MQELPNSSSVVKQLIIKPISSTDANAFVKTIHYSGKVVANSQLHLGVFLKDKLCGVMQFGPPMNKKAVLGLVVGTGWSEMIELNRMAFSDFLPKNSESRALGYAIKLIKKNYPHIKWILTFADGTQCGDGTIYRASNFILTGIKKNQGLRQNPKTGEILQTIAAHHRMIAKEFRQEWTALEGFQLRYMYLLHNNLKLTVPILPFSTITKFGAQMYKGEKLRVSSVETSTTDFQSVGDGVSPIDTLHLSKDDDGQTNKTN